MKHSLQVTQSGGIEVLKFTEQSSEPIIPTGVRIRVAAAGVNFADLMMRMGLYPEAPSPPFTPGYEVAGQVLEVGKDVKTFKSGDRVLAVSRFGGYTTEIVLDEFQVRKIPGKLTETEAAAIPVNFLTAMFALEEMARVRKGDRVLIQSAAGGVGIAAVQIAVLAGAEVVGLVSDKKKEKILKSLGVSEVLTYDEWEKDEKKMSGTFQVILDSQGGQGLKRDFKRLAPGGRIVTFGASQLVSGKKRSLSKLISFFASTPFFTSFRLMNENKGVYGLNMLKLFEPPVAGKPPLLTDIFNRLMDKFEDGSFKVYVGKTFPLENGGSAHAELQGRGNIGKIILISKAPPLDV